MKNPLFVLVLLSITFAILSGCSDGEKGDVLATKIQYDVPIYSEDPQLDWWVNNLEGSKRDPFTKRLMDAVESGEVRVYDYFSDPLSVEEILAMKFDTVFQTLRRNVAPYDEYDTVIYYELTYRDITKIRFLEEWRWDPESLEMEKRVLGIAPVTMIVYEGQEYNRPLYWIYLEEGYPEE
jgi:hypothetical protein